MEPIKEVQEEIQYIFSRLEREVLKLLEVKREGATIYEIARELNCCFKSLYAIVRFLKENK